jgi:hypothetical protein
MFAVLLILAMEIRGAPESTGTPTGLGKGYAVSSTAASAIERTLGRWRGRANGILGAF